MKHWQFAIYFLVFQQNCDHVKQINASLCRFYLKFHFYRNTIWNCILSSYEIRLKSSSFMVRNKIALFHHSQYLGEWKIEKKQKILKCCCKMFPLNKFWVNTFLAIWFYLWNINNDGCYFIIINPMFESYFIMDSSNLSVHKVSTNSVSYAHQTIPNHEQMTHDKNNKIK